MGNRYRNMIAGFGALGVLLAAVLTSAPLVVDTTDFNDLSWFDRAGNFHSDALHVLERFTAADKDHLNYEATIEARHHSNRRFK